MNRTENKRGNRSDSDLYSVLCSKSPAFKTPICTSQHESGTVRQRLYKRQPLTVLTITLTSRQKRMKWTLRSTWGFKLNLRIAHEIHRFHSEKSSHKSVDFTMRISEDFVDLMKYEDLSWINLRIYARTIIEQI